MNISLLLPDVVRPRVVVVLVHAETSIWVWRANDHTSKRHNSRRHERTNASVLGYGPLCHYTPIKTSLDNDPLRISGPAHLTHVTPSFQMHAGQRYRQASSIRQYVRFYFSRFLVLHSFKWRKRWPRAQKPFSRILRHTGSHTEEPISARITWCALKFKLHYIVCFSVILGNIKMNIID